MGNVIIQSLSIWIPVMLVIPTLVLIIRQSKKGKMKKVNGLIDKMVPSAKDKASPAKPEAKPEKSEWEKNKEIMTCIRLTVGNSYQCMLTETEKYEVGSRRVWTSTEPFVGKIDENSAVFTACKAGSTYIECSEVLLYYIDVQPKYKQWFAAEAYEMISTGKGKTEDGTRIAKQMKELLGRSFVDAIFDCNEKGIPARVLLTLRNSEALQEKIYKGLAERMEPLAKTEHIEYWCHKTGQKADGQIDFAAFLTISPDNEILFGIGENWKEEGNAAEFKANTGVFVHTFGKFMDENLLPDIAVNEEKTVKPAAKPSQEETEQKGEAEETISKKEDPAAENESQEEQHPEETGNTEPEEYEESGLPDEHEERIEIREDEPEEEDGWDESAADDQFVNEDFLNEERILNDEDY